MPILLTVSLIGVLKASCVHKVSLRKLELIAFDGVLHEHGNCHGSHATWDLSDV